MLLIFVENKDLDKFIMLLNCSNIIIISLNETILTNSHLHNVFAKRVFVVVELFTSAPLK